MNETGKMRSNVEKVLRAMDVIPPFHEDRGKTPPAGEPAPGEPAGARIQPWKRPREQNIVRKEASPPTAAADGAGHIPTLDLGEKILAEQRRMTARKRKAPGSVQAEPKEIQAPPVVALRAERAVEPSALDAARLEQLVAEIVARDIDRLCSGPVRAMA